MKFHVPTQVYNKNAVTLLNELYCYIKEKIMNEL